MKYLCFMKKIFVVFILLSLFTLLFSFFSLHSLVFAEDAQYQNVYLAKQDVINADFFGFGETVTVDGTVNGDAYIAGGNVTVNGRVNGDLLIAGGNVTITGVVSGNIRGAGGNIFNSAKVGRNVTLAGGSLIFSEPGEISGSLVTAGGTIALNSPIGKDVNAAAGQLSFGNQIGGVVNARVGTISFSPQAQIAGDLNYWNEKELAISPEASIGGKVNYHYEPRPQYVQKEKDPGKILGIATAGSLLFGLYVFIVQLLIGLLIIKLIPVFMKETMGVIAERPLGSLGLGFLAVILVPVLFLLLLISVVGVPLAFALVVAMILYWIVSGITIALFVGIKAQYYFGQQKTSLYWSYLVGLLIMSLVSLIPIINFLVGMVSYLIGMGALLLQKKQVYSSLRQKEFI